MLQMNQNYEPEFKEKIVRLHLEESSGPMSRFSTS